MEEYFLVAKVEINDAKKKKALPSHTTHGSHGPGILLSVKSARSLKMTFSFKTR